MVISIDTFNLILVLPSFMPQPVQYGDSDSSSHFFHVTPKVGPTSIQHQLREFGVSSL